MQESDPHVRILKENADYFAEYTCFEIDEAITVRISVKIWTNKSLYSDNFHAVN